MKIDQLLKIQKTGGKVAVIGIGQENRQFLQWFEEVVAFPKSQIVLADKFSIKDLDLSEYAQVFEGENYLECLQIEDVELVFKAPGIWSLLPEFEEFRQKKGDDAIHSSLVFFLEKYREQIIGITGTKGKSTVSSLTNHLLNELGGDLKSIYCGNTTNISPYKYWTELEQVVDSRTLFVIELSSFQLQDLGYSQTSPKYSIVTNYYIDHLDQHKDAQEYWGAKNNIFLYQKSDDVFVSTRELIEKAGVDNYGQKLIQLDEKGVQEKVKGYEFVLPGKHNQTNLALSLEMLELFLSPSGEDTQKALDSYSPLPYRNQQIRADEANIKISGQEKILKINWINDGAATEPDAVAAAINTFGEDYLWVQFAGKAKGGDYSKVVDALIDVQKNGNLFRVDYCGQVGETLLSELYQKLGVNQKIETSDFVEIVSKQIGDIKSIKENFEKWINNKIKDLESVEDQKLIEEIFTKKILELNIVFSPCGTSFDNFESYIKRAEFWNKNVKK